MKARDFLYDFVKKELIGPSSEITNKANQEIIVGTSPKTRYISGILFPKTQKVEELDNDDGFCDVEEQELDVSEAEGFYDDEEETFIPSDLSDDSEECLNLSNAFKQSAISLTFATSSTEGIDVDVSAALYKKVELTDEKHSVGFERNPIKFHLNKADFSLPKKTEPFVVSVRNGTDDTDLTIHIFYRYTRKNVDVYTISLVNNATSSDSLDTSKWFFQTELSISSATFCRMPENKRLISDEDYENNRLLYRKEIKYSIGHGCSPVWEKKDGVITIHASFLPTYEIDSIVPRIIDDVTFSMKYLYVENDGNIINNLTLLVSRYQQWIDEQKHYAEALREEYPIAEKNIEKCIECSERIKKGIELLSNNGMAMKAFRYMNQSMLMQQLHYRIKKKEWDKDNPNVLTDHTPIPDLNDQNTWGGVRGEWRPFQIAFILLNIQSFVDVNSPEHRNVELIWFPTGGGKTEAYLGLSAFVIFYRRLLNKNDSGTDIIMRYTLRLLTAQQYERASSLICSAEFIRANNSSELGSSRISIGLWVGSATTPNKDTEACTHLNQLAKGKTKSNPFLITKCPWCGAAMGVVPTNGRTRIAVKGYYSLPNPVTGEKTFAYMCDNHGCYYHTITLPLSVVDEQIYNNPPTLLIGTVDKFANLPFMPKAKSIFGIKGSSRVKNVSLIIQDELHLISGPLGSTVSLYETLIDYLTSDYSDPDNPIVPKIIASTATISMAKTQCKNLFGREESKVKIFPPSCIDNGESFFATKKAEIPGRKYVGIYAPASSSQSTATIRLLTSLLHGGARIDENPSLQDAYWTNIVYFNSLRELGAAATWVNGDIKEYSQTVARRIGDGIYRYPNNYAELTSRIDSHEVSYYLDELSVSKNSQTSRAIDICLATNMISVGLDITRLGLMTIAGQPKTTSEYIQTTSRVGRSTDLPGIVFTVYNPNKPRDKSVFENFIDYHSKMYSYVEPTSVTPYSPQLRKKAIAAVFFGIIRLCFCNSGSENPDHILSANQEVIEKVKEIILSRVSFVEPEEYDNTKEQLESIIKTWKIVRYQSFGPLPYAGVSVTPCFYPSSSEIVKPSWRQSYPIPTSMRDVDSECCVDVSDD